MSRMTDNEVLLAVFGLGMILLGIVGIVGILGVATESRNTFAPTEPVVATMGSGWHSEAPPEDFPVLGLWYDEAGVPRSHVVLMLDGNAWEYKPNPESNSVRCFEMGPPRVWQFLP